MFLARPRAHGVAASTWSERSESCSETGEPLEVIGSIPVPPTTLEV